MEIINIRNLNFKKNIKIIKIKQQFLISKWWKLIKQQHSISNGWKCLIVMINKHNFYLII